MMTESGDRDMLTRICAFKPEYELCQKTFDEDKAIMRRALCIIKPGSPACQSEQEESVEDIAE